MMNESPPVLVGERVFWLGSGSGLPKRGTVKWLGRLAEMGPGWAVGVELEEELPVGGIDGDWGGRKLFSCRPKHGLIVPAQSLLGQRRIVIEGTQTTGRERQKGRRLTAQSRRLENENTSAVTSGKSNAFSSTQRSTDRRPGRILEPRPGDHLTRSRDAEDVFSWMVDRQRQHERAFLSRMDARRRELNRSLDEGLACDSPRNSYHSARSAGSKRASGIFNLFRWFRKERSEDSEGEPPSEPGSPVLPRGPSLTGSVDTLFSTATAASFAYVHPLQYRPFGLANQPEIRIQVGPETSTYRNRIRDRDRLRALEKNISLREKYRLYASGTLPRSVDHIHELTDDLNEFKKALEAHKERCSTLGRKKRRAPEPPTPQSSIEEDSENKQPESALKQHRRTVSEPVKFHVKGKRKAPPPPGTSIDSDVISISTSNSNSSRRSRKKRRAPSPPAQNKENSHGIVNIIREATNGILNEEFVASGTESQKEETASNASTLDIGLADVVCTDTLKLERGILKPNMDRPYTEPKICPSSPVSPRPWYKRAANKDTGSMRDKEKKKERDRRKVEDWMIESGIPRRSLINYDNKYNIFSRHDKTEDKRKSQISILTNISELDREAAEIIRRGKEREKNLIDSQNAMYYGDNVVLTDKNIESKTKNGENVPNNSSSDVFSLFNAITKVKTSSSALPHTSSTVLPVEIKPKIQEQKYEKNFKNDDNKHPIEIESLDEVIHRRIPQKPEIVIVEEDKPGTSSSSSVNSNGKIARVTIEELDDFDAERNSKSQLLFEANKQNRNLSPPIPTITEVSEGSAKSSPTSTIVAEKPEPNTPAPPTEIQLIQVKQMNVWICPRCTLENLRWRITCEACDMWRPNPFELREKTNIVPVNNANKNEPTNKNSITSNKENKFLYPNLTPLKPEPEKTPQPRNTDVNIVKSDVKEKTVPEKKEVGKKIADPLASSNRFNEETKKTIFNDKHIEKDVKVTNVLDSKIMYDKEPKAVKVMYNSNLVSESAKTNMEPTNNIQTSVTAIAKETTKKEENKSENTSNVVKTELFINESKDQKPLPSTEADEVRKARLAFFNKPAVDKSKEENGVTVKTDEKKVSNLKLEEGNKAVNSEKDNENKKPLVKTVTLSSEKNNKLNESKILNNNVMSIQPHGSTSKVEVTTTIEIQKQPNVSLNDDIEKKKLKEMLIEMKHSLPKRPKPVKKLEHQNAIDDKSKESKTDVISLPSTSNKEPKSNENLVQPSTSTIVPTPLTSGSNEYAEAYLIESETVVEEIKIKRPSEKVSSSVQTSGLVTQIAPTIKPSSGRELVIPIKIEEHTIKDGVLYTSVSSGVKKIGTGTFQLLRPRDFANIKEIKTESKTGAPLPVYANIADDDSNASVKSEEAGVNSSDYIDKLSKQLVKPQGVANFKARLDVRNDKNMNTLAVNRLLKRLEGAIAGGQHELAAALARELAQMKVNCSVIRQKPELPTKEILLELYVEDKASHQGPFHLKVRPSLTVLELKELVEREYEIPLGVQRWILANQLASDEARTLESMGVNTDGFPIFLYLVAPDPNTIKIEEVINIEVKPSTSKASAVPVEEDAEEEVTEKTPTVLPPTEEPQPGPSGVKSKKESPEPQANPIGTLALGWKCGACTLLNSPTRPGCAACGTGRPQEYQVPEQYRPNEAEARRMENEAKNDQASAKNVEEEKAQNYQKLVDLEKDDLIIYPEEFECPVCLVEYPKMEGIVLRECLHVFCRTCLGNTIHFSEEAEVKCPFRDNNYTCDSTLLEREIKALVTPKAFEEHLAKSIALAETKIGNAFHCKTPDCVGWCIYEDNVNVFKCPVCTHTNCLTCQAVHEGLDCKQYQEQLNNNSDMNIEVKRTKEMLQEMVDRGEAMNCPTCQVVLMKKWGCDWLRCSMCKTEICWITRGPRWGPNGKGDTSGGCQCGVNGIKCHPKCTYCH